MLQKIENGFLFILRSVVLAAAALSLIGFIIFGFGALKLAKGEPEAQAPKINVSSQQIIDTVTNKQPAQASAPVATTTGEQKSQDNKNAYEKAYKAIAKYAIAVSGPQVTINRDKVVSVINERAKTITDDGIRTDYINGMGAALEKVLGSADLIKHARQAQDPYEIIDKTMNAYSEQFNSQIAANEASNATAKQKYFEEKVEGMQSLYYAAGLFGTFLLIIFLSIFIKIERNLRHLENLSTSKAETTGKQTI